MGFVLEVIGRFILEFVFGFLFNLITGFFRHIVFDGVYHAAMFYRFGIRYLRTINKGYDSTLKGRMGVIAFSTITFLWVIILGAIGSLLVAGIVWVIANCVL